MLTIFSFLPDPREPLNPCSCIGVKDFGFSDSSFNFFWSPGACLGDSSRSSYTYKGDFRSSSCDRCSDFSSYEDFATSKACKVDRVDASFGTAAIGVSYLGASLF